MRSKGVVSYRKDLELAARCLSPSSTDFQEKAQKAVNRSEVEVEM